MITVISEINRFLDSQKDDPIFEGSIRYVELGPRTVYEIPDEKLDDLIFNGYIICHPKEIVEDLELTKAVLLDPYGMLSLSSILRKCPIVKVFQRNRKYVYVARAWDEVLLASDFTEALYLALAGMSDG